MCEMASAKTETIFLRILSFDAFVLGILTQFRTGGIQEPPFPGTGSCRRHMTPRNAPQPPGAKGGKGGGVELARAPLASAGGHLG